MCVWLLCQVLVMPASLQATVPTRPGRAEVPKLRAGHYPHHHRLDLDLQGNGGVFGGDGAGENAPPVPMKLPPEHLFTCTVGRNRSQARRGPRPPGGGTSTQAWCPCRCRWMFSQSRVARARQAHA